MSYLSVEQWRNDDEQGRDKETGGNPLRCTKKIMKCPGIESKILS
jgi:hypothetical protein